jgi:hypothetical protein
MMLNYANGKKAKVRVFYTEGPLAVVMPEKLVYDDNLMKRWAAVIHVPTGDLVLPTRTVLAAKRALRKLLAMADWTTLPTHKPEGLNALLRSYRSR